MENKASNDDRINPSQMYYHALKFIFSYNEEILLSSFCAEY